MVRTVREQREPLAATSGTPPAFDLELALIFARNRVSAAYAVPMLVVIVALASLLWVQPAIAAAWATVVLIAHFAMVAVCRRYVKLASADVGVRPWFRRFVALEFIGSLAWAGIACSCSAQCGGHSQCRPGDIFAVRDRG